MFGILESKTDPNKELVATFLAPLSIESYRFKTSSDTLNLRRLSNVSVAQRWEFSGELLVNNPVAFYSKLIKEGVDDVLHIIPPMPVKKFYQSTGAYAISSAVTLLPAAAPVGIKNRDIAFSEGVVKVKITASVSTSTVVLDSSATADYKILKGDFIQFTNIETKTYSILNHSYTAANEHTIEIFPALEAPLAVNDNAYLGSDVVMAVEVDLSTVAGMSYQDGILENIGTLKFIEAKS
jgi:hypothetical protein